MSRTAVAAGLVSLAFDAGVQLPASGQAADATNGNYVPFSTGSSYGPFQTFLQVINGDSSSHSVILRASGYTGAPSGAANSGLVPPQNTVFTQSTVGDLTIAVAAGKTEIIGLFNTDRFTQPDGSLWFDWTAATSMTFYVFQMPVTVS